MSVNISHPKNSGDFELTSSDSDVYSHLAVEKETVNTAEVQTDLNELSVEAAESEQSRDFPDY